MLRGFGLKVGKTTPPNFAERIKELVSEHSNLQERWPPQTAAYGMSVLDKANTEVLAACIHAGFRW